VEDIIFFEIFSLIFLTTNIYTTQAKGLANIIKTSYAKTATVYKSAQSMKRTRRSSIFGDDDGDYDDISEKNGSNDDEKEEEEGKVPEDTSYNAEQPLNFKPLIPDDDFVSPPGLCPTMQRVKD
tara:strand:- start:15 stop:386 length:372 start_codon:yes stop_codon:yes gene_type:complete